MLQSTTRADNSNGGLGFFTFPIPLESLFPPTRGIIQRAMTTADLKDIPSYAAAAAVAE